MKLNEYRALNARWLNQIEAAFYCGFSVNHFKKEIRKHIPEDSASRPVMFDRLKLDAIMESRQIGNLPVKTGRVSKPTSASERRQSA